MFDILATIGTVLIVAVAVMVGVVAANWYMGRSTTSSGVTESTIALPSGGGAPPQF